MKQIYTKVTPELFNAIRQIIISRSFRNLGSLDEYKSYIGIDLNRNFVETANHVGNPEYVEVNLLTFVSLIKDR